MRPDASMSLLSDLASEAMEPEYLTTTSPRRSRWAMPLALLMVATLLVLSVVSTTRSRSDVADEREDLLSRIAAEQQHRDEFAARASELDAENRQLRQDAVADPSVRANLQETELAAGAIAVSGPGLRARANDAERTGNGSRAIYDSDLSRLVNGLWQAGAEAVAVNGHRITTLTPIRGICHHGGLRLPEPALCRGSHRGSFPAAGAFRPYPRGSVVAVSSRQLWDHL